MHNNIFSKILLQSLVLASELCLNIIEYKANPICSLYKVFKKAEAYFDMLNAKF